MLRIFFFSAKSGLKKVVQKDAAKELRKKTGFLWIDIEKPTAEEIRFAHELLNIHPTHLEAALDPYQTPIIANDDTMKAIMLKFPSQDQSTSNLTLFYGKNYLLTLRHDEQEWFQPVMGSLQKNPASAGNTPLSMLAKILRRISEIIKGEIITIEEALPDFSAENVHDINKPATIRLIGMKLLSAKIQNMLMDTSEIFDVVEESMEEISSDPEEIAEINRAQNLWYSTIEHLQSAITVIDSAFGALQLTRFNQINRKLSALLNCLLVAFPIIILLIISYGLGPILPLPKLFNLVAQALLPLLLGSTIGLWIIKLFRS